MVLVLEVRDKKELILEHHPETDVVKVKAVDVGRAVVVVEVN
jgi:hypothetical protein